MARRAASAEGGGVSSARWLAGLAAARGRHQDAVRWLDVAAQVLLISLRSSRLLREPEP